MVKMNPQMQMGYTKGLMEFLARAEQEKTKANSINIKQLRTIVMELMAKVTEVELPSEEKKEEPKKEKEEKPPKKEKPPAKEKPPVKEKPPAKEKPPSKPRGGKKKETPPPPPEEESGEEPPEMINHPWDDPDIEVSE